VYSEQTIIICDIGGEVTWHADFLLERLRDGDHSKHIGADERIILKLI
jgi:hypothetical protein